MNEWWFGPVVLVVSLGGVVFTVWSILAVNHGGYKRGLHQFMEDWKNDAG